jgi:hypothetical protein
MKEEYSVKENKMEKEFRDVSEFNEESRIGENVEYASEGGYNGPEFQDYGEDKSAERLSRHSTLMRNNRNRLGRLLAMLTVVAGGAVAVMLLLTATVFVDVIRYKSQPESLYVELSLLSSAEDTELTAVLTDREGHEIESVRVDPELPHLLFDDLTPGGFYYLEVFADGESKLKRNYILPEYPDREEETATPTPENTPVNETATPVNATEPPATDVPATDTPEATGTPTPEVTDTPTPDVTETPTGTPTPTPGPTDTPTPDVTETPTGTPTPTPEPTETPTPVPEPSFSFVSEEKTFSSFKVTLTAENIDVSTLTATVNGNAATLEPGSNGRFTVSAEGLEPATEYTYTIKDSAGNSVYSGNITTANRTPASVTVTSENISYNSATLSFAITNPDSNPVTVKYDGTIIESSLTGSTYSREFTGLVTGATHTVEFVDWDGTVILSHSFAARDRQAATVTLASETLDFDSATLSFTVTNPESGELTIKYDGSTLATAFTGTSYSRSFTGLVSGASHTIEFVDWNGDVIFTHTFAAKTRQAATVTLASQEIGYDSAVLSFTITNPDSGELTIKYDGSTLESGFTPNSFNHSLTGLVSGVNHTFEFIDWNGDVIFTHTFAARDRTTATVTFSNVTPGFNSVAVELSVDNPDGNDLQLKIGSTVLTTDFTAATPTATATGLTPRTSYTLTVTDLSTGTQVATTTVETASSVTWEKNASGDYVFTFEDDFFALYPRATVSVTDSKGYTINLTSSSENSATLAANDFVYTDSYTVTIKNGDTVVDTLTSNLSGSARPVFTLEYASFTPATIAEAYNDTDYHISYSGYPHFSYNLVSGLVQNNILDDGSFEDGPQRWTAMVIKDSSGTVMSVIVSGLGGMETDNGLAESGTLWIQPIDTVYDEIPDGTYTAALYTADGFTLDDMSEFLNKLYNDGITADEGIPYVFTDAGRKISDDATFTKTTSDPIGDAWVYNQADPYVAEGPVTVRSFGGSYTAPEDGVEGFLTIVSASDPTVQLITPVSLGTSTDGASFTTGDLSYNSAGAVYIIIYSRSFSPENFLCVWYCESP